jgi:hypothetical protein
VCGDPDVPQCVLAELGRMEDDAEFGEAVWWHWYSGRNLSAKQAAEALKRMRTEDPRGGPGNALQASDEDGGGLP